LSAVLWRIAQETRDFRAEDLSGGGAAKVGGRWNSPGQAVVYTLRSVALAYLESLAHLGHEVPRKRFLIRIIVPDQVWNRALCPKTKDLPRTWRAEPAGFGSMRFGDRWLVSGDSALLCPQSVIVPEDTNVLINPLHPDARLIRGRVERQLLYDLRLLRL
jgi:RES domain-containing protein